MDRLPDALPASKAVIVVERVVYSTVEPRDGSFSRRFIERVERPGLLRRYQTVVAVSCVSEALNAEHVG